MSSKVNVSDVYSLSDAQVLQLVGERIQKKRLHKNITQENLSKQAGISRKTLSDLEKGVSGNLSTFIQVLRALEELEGVLDFLPEIPVSPVQLKKLQGKQRKRASSPGKSSGREESEW